MSSSTNNIFNKKNIILFLVILSVCIISGLIIKSHLSAAKAERIKKEITAVWDADSLCGKNAKSTREHCYYMRKIYIANCPEDFQKAYIARYQAWEKMADFEEVDMAMYRRRYDSWSMFLEALERGALAFDFSIFTEEREVARNLGNKYTSIWVDIRTTLDHAFLIARKYGVDTSKYEELAIK